MDFTKREGGPIISGEMDLGWYNLDSESTGLNRIFLQKNEYNTQDGLLPFGEPTFSGSFYTV